MRFLWEKRLDVYVVLGFVILAGTGKLLVGGLWEPLNAAYFSIALLLFVLNYKQAIVVPLNSPLISLLILMAVASILWSDKPRVTTIRSAALILLYLFTIFIVSQYELKHILKLLYISGMVLVLASIVFLIVFPSHASTGSAYWRGAFAHKATLGQNMAIVALVCLVVPLSRPFWRFIRVITFIIAVLLIIKSSSLTPLLLVIAVATVSIVVKLIHYNKLVFIAILFMTAVPVWQTVDWASANMDEIREAFGKDSTLTGRTDVWARIPYALAERPVLGYGYSGFWGNWEGVYGTLWSRANDHWLALSAHQAFVDVQIQLGMVGLVLFAFNMALLVLGSIYYILTNPSSEHQWPSLYLILIVLLSIAGSFALYIDLTWMLYQLTACYLGYAFYRRRNPPEPQRLPA